jgi:hypothetical protein
MRYTGIGGGTTMARMGIIGTTVTWGVGETIATQPLIIVANGQKEQAI